jgi:hypothetical protein
MGAPEMITLAVVLYLAFFHVESNTGIGQLDDEEPHESEKNLLIGQVIALLKEFPLLNKLAIHDLSVFVLLAVDETINFEVFAHLFILTLNPLNVKLTECCVDPLPLLFEESLFIDILGLQLIILLLCDIPIFKLSLQPAVLIIG